MLTILFSSIFGTIENPTSYNDFEGGGPGRFISNIIKAAIVIAGLYAIINFILAGYAYLSAAGDPKKASEATTKITQSVIGLVIIVCTFILGGIISNILFGDPTTIFQLNIEGPTAPNP